MRRITIYLATASLTFFVGVAAAVVWFMHDQSQIEEALARVTAPIVEEPSPGMEAASAYVSFDYVGAEQAVDANGRCISVQKYLSRDGVEVRHTLKSYKTSAWAGKEFRRALTNEVKVIRQESITNGDGLKIGGTATTLHSFNDDAGEVYSVLTWVGKDLYRSNSPSQRHLLIFEHNYKADEYVNVCR